MHELIDLHINNELIELKTINKDDYDIVYTDLITDAYWNYALLKNKNCDINKLLTSLKKDMQSINRKPVLYITSDILDNKIKEELTNNNFLNIYTDVWLVLDQLNDFEYRKSKVSFITKRVTNSLKDKFIAAVMDGFASSNPEDPYESLSDEYKVAFEKSLNNEKHNIINYLGLKDDEGIATASVIYKDNRAIIYNVTTSKKYKRQGVCRELMGNIINDLKDLGITELCLQTEKGFYTEDVYKNMGFVPKMEGKAYTLKE